MWSLLFGGYDSIAARSVPLGTPPHAVVAPAFVEWLWRLAGEIVRISSCGRGPGAYRLFRRAGGQQLAPDGPAGRLKSGARAFRRCGRYSSADPARAHRGFLEDTPIEPTIGTYACDSCRHAGEMEARRQPSHRRYTIGRDSDRPMICASNLPHRWQQTRSTAGGLVRTPRVGAGCGREAFWRIRHYDRRRPTNLYCFVQSD